MPIGWIMTENQVKSAVDAAVAKLLEHDSYLLEKNVNERSISHCLAVHLAPLFPSWNVDCEYNRNHDDVKRLLLESRDTTDKDTEAVTVFPDIIIHRRSSDDNLLVIEMKKTMSRENGDYDIRKLRAFKSELKYTYAVSIVLETGFAKPKVKSLDYI
jgi:hypothetical protein